MIILFCLVWFTGTWSGDPNHVPGGGNGKRGEDKRGEYKKEKTSEETASKEMEAG
ncbi:hypothetical protein HMSSN036_85450 [Paenibacillus macerans]|nr:hypothetical protein HMSSN036_85450 [Paenibacillus macerans]